MPAATSSRVSGTPPPAPSSPAAPTRRYSSASTAQPASTRPGTRGSAYSMPYSAFQNPPCTTTTTPRGVPAGRVSTAYWLGSSP